MSELLINTLKLSAKLVIKVFAKSQNMVISAQIGVGLDLGWRLIRLVLLQVYGLGVIVALLLAK